MEETFAQTREHCARMRELLDRVEWDLKLQEESTVEQHQWTEVHLLDSVQRHAQELLETAAFLNTVTRQRRTVLARRNEEGWRAR